MTAQHGLDTGAETVNADDPRFTRPYDASDEKVWTHRKTPDGWVDRDRDESCRWAYWGTGE